MDTLTPSTKRISLLVALAFSLIALSSCAPTNTSDPANAFEWYADGCVTAAETAQDLYSGADNPVGRQIAETAIDALVAAGKKVTESISADNPILPRLTEVLASVEDRTRLTDISEQDRVKFEKNKGVILDSIGEVGQMCRSVFAGFDVTRTPTPDQS